MKVTWEAHDMRPKTMAHKDMNCMVCRDFDVKAPAVLIVVETGRVMKIGTQEEVAQYMTDNEYIPGEK